MNITLAQCKPDNTPMQLQQSAKSHVTASSSGTSVNNKFHQDTGQ